MAPTPLRDEKEDVVKSGALRLTWVSGAVGGVAAIVTAFNEHILKIFGDDVSDGTKASVLIAIIAAWAVIAVADLLARAITTAARLKRAPSAITAPEGMQVKLIQGVDKEDEWMVAAIRRSDDGSDTASEFLVVNSQEAPKWVKQDEIALKQ